MIKYRPHRRFLDEAMAEVQTFEDRAALVAHLNERMKHWGFTLTDTDVKIEPYGFDDRINWDTHIVTVRNVQRSDGRRYFGSHMKPDYFGAIGFTDGPA